VLGITVAAGAFAEQDFWIAIVAGVIFGIVRRRA